MRRGGCEFSTAKQIQQLKGKHALLYAATEGDTATNKVLVKLLHCLNLHTCDQLNYKTAYVHFAPYGEYEENFLSSMVLYRSVDIHREQIVFIDK